MDAGEYYGSNKEIDKQHVVATWQSLQNNPQLMSLFQMFIIDEAHGVKGQVIYDLITESGKNIPFRFGVTGTFPKPLADQMTLKSTIGQIHKEIPAKWLIENSKVFVYGRVSAEEEKDAKLICEKITPFESIPRKLWIKFPTKEDYLLKEEDLRAVTDSSDGNDTVVIYIEATKEIKNLPRSRSVCADNELLTILSTMFGGENVRVV